MAKAGAVGSGSLAATLITTTPMVLAPLASMADGKVWYNNVHWAWINGNGVGDRICFAVDTINRQWWVRVNNNGWVGWTTNNPAYDLVAVSR